MRTMSRTRLGDDPENVLTSCGRKKLQDVGGTMADARTSRRASWTEKIVEVPV